MQSQINRITDILRRDDGISGAMHYTEQISRVLFLKFLDEYEKTQALEAQLAGKSYQALLDDAHQWNIWAIPQINGKKDTMHAMT
jgi:type I restriction enzyme M protein